MGIVIIDNSDPEDIIKHSWIARCPVCKRVDSMAIVETLKGRVFTKCFYGCTLAEVRKALGLPAEPN